MLSPSRSAANANIVSVRSNVKEFALNNARKNAKNGNVLNADANVIPDMTMNVSSSEKSSTIDHDLDEVVDGKQTDCDAKKI